MLKLKNLKTSSVLEVKHLQYSDWPDNQAVSLEDSPFQVLRFILRAIHQERLRVNNPVVVHCSAGIGRTGTLIGLYNIIESVEYL